MNSEFSVAGSYGYDRSSPVRWILSHIWRHRFFAITAVLAMVAHNGLNSMVQWLIGRAFDRLLEPSPDRDALISITIALIVIVACRSVLDLGASFLAQITAQRLERDSREELYQSLLGKSQTFHNKQRVGDLMARANNDVRQLTMMIQPGAALIIDSFSALFVPIIFIAFLKWQLLLSPLIFTVIFIVLLRRYMRKMEPVAARQRMEFGQMNSVLTESVTGIEVVKSTAQEAQEQAKFLSRARAYRDAAVRQGRLEAGYLPTLFVGFAIAGAAIHGLILIDRGELTVGQLVTYLGLMGLLRFPAYMSIFSFSLVQLGRVSAHRILDLINERTDLDQNTGGHTGRIQGKIEFADASFTYGGEPVLEHVSFTVEPGRDGRDRRRDRLRQEHADQAGQPHLRRDGRPGPDRRRGRARLELDTLRSQISTIEQDIFLFSRPVAENIAFSLGQDAPIEAIRQAARDAQADELHQRDARRLRDRNRRARRDPLRRPAAADRDRQSVADRSAHPDPRRFDQRDRQRYRGPDPARNQGDQRRSDDAADHAPSQPDPLG